MTTFSQNLPKVAANWVNQAVLSSIPIAIKIVGGSLLTLSNPIDVGVTMVARECIKFIGAKGIYQLNGKFKFTPRSEMQLSLANFTISSLASLSIVKSIGYQPSILSMVAGDFVTLVILGIKLNQFSVENQLNEFDIVANDNRDNFQ
ncbi:MAG: hypothetical protein H0X29_05445 [Parachlamydiaceae bacterium]|nr:hypothetical protein [Parachlamydiaceae bacterium]